jgi:apolipoprotein N-acyltransferase
VAGLLIFGYAFGLVKLTNQPDVRHAFYYGLAAGFLCYAPQLVFFWYIFNSAAIVLWLVLAFWIGLFMAIVCGSRRRWGDVKSMWLIPVIWTGLEYFRCELYYLKFSWLNIGYALPAGSWLFGMYGFGFLVVAIVTGQIFFGCETWNYFRKKMTLLEVLVLLALAVIVLALLLPALAETKSRYRPKRFCPVIVGVQMEGSPVDVIPQVLDRALAENTNASIFVLSECTLEDAVPPALKEWCRDHARFLVVGGRDYVTNHVYYNTAFVVGTNGEIVFKQAKSVPVQFFDDGLRATNQTVWDSPWGKIGFCICYDLSYTRVIDRLVAKGAQLLIVPTMDNEDWGWHEHELHSRVAPVRAAEYSLPIFRLASSGMSQAVAGGGLVVAQTRISGYGDILSTQLQLPARGTIPHDRWFAQFCTGVTGIVLSLLLFLTAKDKCGSKRNSPPV